MYLIWNSFLITIYQLCLPYNTHLHKGNRGKKKPTLSEYLKSWLQQIIKSGGFVTVNVAVKAINFEESIDKMMSGNAGRNTVSNKEANKAVGG